MKGDNEISEIGQSALINQLVLYENLKFLGLNNCNIKSESIIELSNILGDYVNLQELQLNDNQIDDEGLISLGINLSSLSSRLVRLYLGGNDFSVIGLSCFFECLQFNRSLKSLFLQQNKQMDLASDELNKLLIQNETLQNLCLGDCELDDEFIKQIEFGLRNNKHLQTLSLWKNNLTHFSLKTLINIIEDYNKTIHYIDLENNLIDSETKLDLLDELLVQNRLFLSIDQNLQDILNTQSIIPQPQKNNKELNQHSNTLDQSFEVQDQQNEIDYYLSQEQTQPQLQKYEQIQQQEKDQQGFINYQWKKHNQKINNQVIKSVFNIKLSKE